MNIWFLEIGEPLPIEPDARLHRVGQLSRYLAHRGHHVVWWTSTFTHAKKTFVRPADCKEMVDGVHLYMLHGRGYRRNVSLRRFRHQAEFGRRFLQLAKKEALPDLLFASVPTIEGASAAVEFAREHDVPAVVDICDEWPDELVDIAPKPLRWAARIALRHSFLRMRWVCRNASAITGVSRRFMDYGLKHSDRAAGPSDGVFPLGYSRQPMSAAKVEKAKRMWKEKGVREDAFVACFFGTIGRFFDLGTVIEMARIVSREIDLQVVLCGDGSNFSKFKTQARDLPNVFFPGWVDAPQIAALMELSAIGLAPYAAGVRMSLPNKPFEYFAGRLPVISSLQGELKELLREGECGLTYAPGSVAELCSIVRRLHADPEDRRRMGDNGRRLLDERYSMEVIFDRLESHLLSIHEQSRDCRAPHVSTALSSPHSQGAST